MRWHGAHRRYEGPFELSDGFAVRVPPLAAFRRAGCSDDAAWTDIEVRQKLAHALGRLRIAMVEWRVMRSRR